LYVGSRELIVHCLKWKDSFSKHKTHGKLKVLNTVQSPTYFPSGKEEEEGIIATNRWFISIATSHSQSRIYRTDFNQLKISSTKGKKMII
jgi:hypothetical protein